MKPLRFGVMLWHLPGTDWIAKVHRMESLGYSSILIPDHFGTQWDPIATQAAIAAVTTTLRVGSFVYNVDYRHPVILAKASATIQNISQGRHECAIGAGWDEDEYRQAGIHFDPPGIRVSRLAEAIPLIQQMWTQERTSFAGRHFKVADIPQAVHPFPWGPPKTMIGGGGKRMLALAGRYADIVSLSLQIPGIISSATFQDRLTHPRLREKMQWALDAARNAGRHPDELEFNFFYLPGLTFTDDPDSARDRIAVNWGITPEDVTQAPNFFIGSPVELKADIEQRYKATGINYYIIPVDLDDFDTITAFAESVITPLTGQ